MIFRFPDLPKWETDALLIQQNNISELLVVIGTVYNSSSIKCYVFSEYALYDISWFCNYLLLTFFSLQSSSDFEIDDIYFSLQS